MTVVYAGAFSFFLSPKTNHQEVQTVPSSLSNEINAKAYSKGNSTNIRNTSKEGRLVGTVIGVIV